MTTIESPPMGARSVPSMTVDQTDGDAVAWRERTRLVLTPIAAPSIVGFFGLGAGAFLLAANWAGWYDTSNSALLLAPFVIAFAGIAQLAAALYAFRARDGVATAVHGTWGSLFVALGVVWVLAGTGVLASASNGNTPEGGLWFGIVAVITLACTAASSANSIAMSLTLFVVAVGAGLACGGFVGEVDGLVTAAGWVMLAAALLCAYTAAALMLDEALRKEVLPVHNAAMRRPANGHGPTAVPDVIEYPIGMPGAHAGQ
jgi:succinate-acetate transporter protein